jgi:competence protein ComEC
VASFRLGPALVAERERWFLWVPVLLGIGVGTYFALPSEPSCGVAYGLAFATAALTAFAFLRKGLWPNVLAGALALVLAGFCIAKMRTEIVAAPVLMHRVGPVELDGRVESAQLHGKGIRAVLAVKRIDGVDASRLPRRVRVSVRRGGEVLTPGAVVRLEAVLLPPPPPAAPNDYDFARTAYFEGIGGVGYAFGRPHLIAPSPPPGFGGRIGLTLSALRWRMSARVHAVLPGSTGSIASALITGDRGGISEADEAALRDAGLAHVLAIAGLHMALVGLGLFWAARALLALIPVIALTQPIKKWAALAALGGASFYLVISGAAAPAMRAFTMLAMMLLAILFDRPALSMRSLAFAAIILLMFEPESLVEPGFQMSFAAVASLIAVAEWEHRRAAARERTPPWRFAKVWAYLRGIAVTSFVGSIATMPYAAFHFDRATHYAVLGNLLAMPIMGFVTMPAAAVSVVTMPFGLDAVPLHVMGAGVDAMLAIGRFVSHLPGAVTAVGAWPISALALLSLGGLWILLWRSGPRWLGFAPILAGAVIVLLTRPPDLLIARDGVTIAARGADRRLYFVRDPADEYSASEWLKRDGDARVPDQALASPNNGVRCDALGCIVRISGGTEIAAISRPEAFGEDCAAADIVISSEPARGACRGPRLVIDRIDVARNGAYALWLSRGIAFETVRDARGDRPWSREPFERKAARSGVSSGE